MITDSLLMYLLFQIILFAFNIVGYRKMPLMLFFTCIGTLVVAYPTIMAFEDYPMIGLVLLLINMSIPAIGLTTTVKGK